VRRTASSRRRAFPWLLLLAVVALLGVLAIALYVQGPTRKGGNRSVATRQSADSQGSGALERPEPTTHPRKETGTGLSVQRPAQAKTDLEHAHAVTNQQASKPRAIERRTLWQRRGHCSDERGPAFEQARAEYLATFTPVPMGGATLRVEPSVPSAAVDTLRRAWRGRRPPQGVEQRIARSLGVSSPPPLIYLYRSVAALREHSCVRAPAVAYYDGAIHLAVTEPAPDDVYSQLEKNRQRWLEYDLPNTLLHEATHHALASNGIFAPFWLQEGLAMEIGGGSPRDAYAVWRKNPIRAELLVDAYPDDATPEIVTAYYAQSGIMLEFLQRMCLNRSDCGPAELVRALRGAQTTPEKLFDWAISRRAGDLVRTARLPLWDDYVARGDFAPETLKALLNRAHE
jgi:hypothetical protein